jgi:hypothetical protein
MIIFSIQIIEYLEKNFSFRSSIYFKNLNREVDLIIQGQALVAHACNPPYSGQRSKGLQFIASPSK